MSPLRLAASRWLAHALAFALALGASSPAYAQADEYDVKVAFLYNLALFTLPAGPARDAAEYTMCFHGRHSFGPRLAVLQGRAIDKRRITVRAAADSVAGCDFVFVGELDRRERDAALKALAGKPVVTAIESGELPSAGLMFHLHVDKQRVVVDVNLDAVRAAGMSVGSQMLRVARKVHGGTN